MTVQDWGSVAGVGRDVLERRVQTLVAALAALERRLAGRAEQSARTAETHPDPGVRQLAAARAAAYQLALDDARDALEYTVRYQR